MAHIGTLTVNVEIDNNSVAFLENVNALLMLVSKDKKEEAKTYKD